MTYIKYVSIIEYDDGDRQIRLGKADASGSDLALPSPENDIEEAKEWEWERVSVHDLPREMSKSEFKAWWNSKKEEGAPFPSPIPEVIEGIGDEQKTYYE